MGYFALNLEEDNKENLIATIRSNLELYKQTEKSHSYLLDCFIQGDLNKLIDIAKEEERLEKEAWDLDEPNRKIQIAKNLKRMKELRKLIKENDE